jgi:hypothetical protein
MVFSFIWLYLCTQIHKALTKFNLCKYFLVVSAFLVLLGIQSGFASRQLRISDSEECKILLTETEELTERTAEFSTKDFKQVFTSLFYTYLSALFDSDSTTDLDYQNRIGYIHSSRLFLRFHNLRIPW